MIPKHCSYFVEVYCSMILLQLSSSHVFRELEQLFLFFRFYLPHGLSIDKDGNYWVTDVALHQVSSLLGSVQIEAEMG